MLQMEEMYGNTEWRIQQVTLIILIVISVDTCVARPGQLGDTGIIVLQHCGPLKKKGCECELEEKEEETTKQVTFRLGSHMIFMISNY